VGGERRHVAVLFADIRGFTPLAARMAPDETARLLNDFLTEMVECVFKHGGTLDKFLGDAVMAQWGAPISAIDDADRALEAARDMLRAVEELNAGWRAQDRPEIQIGIGLNYGEAFAGYTGSERRLEYTVIGDTVNTASRLCAWAEGGEILVSASMRNALAERGALTERAPLSLRGKSDPVVVYRAIA
jgi:adenylate cyclase